MLSEEVTEKLVERLVNRIENVNVYVLKKIGETIKRIGTLSPTSAMQLSQTIKYGGDFNEIIKELAKVTELNVKDIYKIFEEVAKKDQEFAKQFYKYRNMEFIPYEKNEVLKRQVESMARITANNYLNLSNTLAFTKKVNGKTIYSSLFETYSNAIDEAVIAISQGKDTFDNQMFKVLKDLGNSGLKTVDYASGYSRRLDSAVRMNMQDALRDLHNANQELFGKEFDSDGVEISVHANPAPDHELAQGRQFSNEEFNNFQSDKKATSYDGMVFEPEYDGKDRRSISQYNCYHTIFSIVLGVSKPEYSEEQLQKIIDENNEGFEFEGKHYSLYDGEQLLRKVELELRKSKDTQILARSSDNVELVWEMQSRITKLTNKYRDILKASGLKSKLERARVSGYRRVNVAKMK